MMAIDAIYSGDVLDFRNWTILLDSDNGNQYSTLVPLDKLRLAATDSDTQIDFTGRTPMTIIDVTGLFDWHFFDNDN